VERSVMISRVSAETLKSCNRWPRVDAGVGQMCATVQSDLRKCTWIKSATFGLKISNG
jgi:hypothetical protein